MAVDFADYFWGDKNEGFSALYQSSKSSPIAAKELGEYFRECGKVQEDHSKTQLKILKQLNGSNSTNGSFSPLLSLFKPFTEKIAGVHHEHMKETSSTSEIVKSFQDITLQLNKSKELYKQKCLELEKMKRSGEKDKDKADLKFRKAQEDYRTLVIQYCTLRETFEAKLTSYARHCQELETNHLIQMREFVQIYFTEVQQFNQQISQANEDFQSQLNKLTVTNLLEQFTMNHHTGLDKPGPIEFEEEKLSVASIPGEHGGSDISDRSGNSDKLSLNSFNKKQDLSVGSNSVVTPSAQQPPPNISTGSGGNLSSSPIPSVSSADNDQLSAHAADGSSNYETEDTSKHGHTEAPDSAPETTSNKMGSDGEDQHKSDTPTPEVDTERFSKSNDKRADLDPWAEFNESKNNFYSSSDESDDETKHKIKVEIKPVSNSNPPISASVDELRSAIGTLDIAPPPPRDIFENGTHDKHDIRRSQSQSYLVHKPSEDLLGLSLHPIGDIDNTTKIMSTTAPMSNNNIKTSDTLKMEIHDISICSSSGNASKEVGDILNETADMSANSMSLAFSSPLPTKEVVVSSVGGNATVINNQRDKVSSSLIALPRPPSRHGPQYPLPQTSSALGSSSTLTNSINSHISMGRSKNSSTSSLGNSESPHPFSNSMSNKFQFGSSRGPSPLTLGMSDNIPLAVAFQEVVHACFHGSDESQCQVRLIGDMMISFPAGIIQMITHNPMTSPLLFRIKNASVLESIVPNKQLINTATALSSDGETAFEFNMKNLKDLLKSQALQNPNASYFNIDILKYQIRAQSGAKSCPLQLVAHWKCDSSHTDLKLNYNENNRALWTFKELRADDRDNNSSSNGGLEVIKGRFELANGPGSQNTIAAQFNCEGSTLSGIDIELIGSGYRLSLIKKRFVSGKYICDAEGKQDSRFRYAFTPSNTLGSDCLNVSFPHIDRVRNRTLLS
ncbi:FCHO [Lepeophtheirus salmonis]|uniref:FCHO n=1 Tax=Lepeophtheirus salmonis TaxID=72036 RepID=A0A7R8CL56_LEPSM|nr:FCHO [Lepeophtheirus salmonis]CAF2853694.1 FCHO [Lepeophtheirus salmonis]